MDSVRNVARERLQAGELSIGLGLRQARTVEIAKTLKTAGYDWLFIDLEHSTMSIDIAAQIAVTALDVGITPLVRVPARQFGLATRALDGGALGIVMPHVDTPEEASEVVRQLRYPPRGHRSAVGALPHTDFIPRSVRELTLMVDSATLVIVMLETPTAIKNAADIAAIDGIDALLIGTNDLAMELGVPGEFGHQSIIDAYATVIASCREHGKWPGMGGVYAEPLLTRYIGMGMRLILGGSDTGMLIQAASQRSNFLRCLLDSQAVPKAVPRPRSNE